MWDQGGGDYSSAGNSMAGGFFAGTPGGSQSETPSGKKGAAQRAHNVIPVLIKDILQSSDDKLKIEETEVHMVTFIGVVDHVESKQTNITYTVRDDTGTIEVVQWIEGDSGSVGSIQVVEQSYCRVIGSVRQSQGKQHIMAFRVVPVVNCNEITSHLLETQYVRLKLKKLRAMMGQSVNDNSSFSSNGGMNMPGPLASNSNNFGSSGINGLTANQAIVYNIIQASTADTGIEKSQIYSSVRPKMGPRDVDAALEFLCSEGHIYSTIDEDHFKSTDS